MIFRAVFFITLVWLLMPHEPDLGLGRPGPWLPSPASILSAAGLSRPGPICESCTGRALAGTRGLADIKAEIEAAIQARQASHAAI